MYASENDVFDILLTYVNREDDVPENLYYELNIADFKKEFGFEYGEKAVRKNLTIPAWLNTFAEKNNISFSKILQDALLSMAQEK